MIDWIKSHPWYLVLSAFAVLVADLILRRGGSDISRNDRTIADDRIAVAGEYGRIATTHEASAQTHLEIAAKIESSPPATADDIATILTGRGL